MADNIFDNIKVQFEQFISSVSNVLSREKEIHLIQNKLRRHFNTTSSSYLCSKDFQTLLTRIHNLFNENNQSTKFFKLLNLFDEQLKKHSIKLIENNVTTIPLESLSANVEQTTITTDSVNQSDIELRRRKKIIKLEHRLSNLSRIIRELEEKELSLDEMRYSDLYLVESKLKKQAYDIYIRLADLKNQSSSVERILDQPVILTDVEIDHPLINKALEDMVNQTRFLPCFNDVFDVVEKTNDRYELGLGVDARKNIAEKAFKIIGIKVKDRRIADFTDIMNSRLPEDFDIEQNDPALDNVELENTLIENEREAIIKTQKIFEEFSQIDPDLQLEVNTESSEESTIESDEEENIDANKDEAESEPDANVNSHDNHIIQNYDAIDILPPFSPSSSPPSPSNASEIINSKDPVEAPVNFSLDDSRFKILSTASIPLKRTARSPILSMTKKPVREVFTLPNSDDSEESQPISIIPRRRQQNTTMDANNEILSSIYQQRITTNDFSTMPKRSVPDIESPESKKRKEITEIVILD